MSMQLTSMPDSDIAAMRVRKLLLEMGDDQIMVEAERALLTLHERDRRLSETLDDLMQEVDRLLLRMDELGLDTLVSDEDEDECYQVRPRGSSA